ncbi:MAG: cellulase family glycosylhydrolase [Oscillospiraceae bacterium]
MKMKKFLAVLLAVVTCLLCTPLTSFAAKAKEFETAHEAVANMHAGLHIGNTFESIDFEDEWFSNDGVNPGWDENHQGRDPEVFETAWGNPPVTKEYIAAIKNAGFDSVCFYVSWGNHADKDANIYEPWLDRVQEVVDMILEQDMYCIMTSADNSAVWLKPNKESFTENSENTQRSGSR